MNELNDILEEYRQMFYEIDELYYINPKPEIRKLNDDLMLAVRNAIENEHKRIDIVINELSTTYSKVVESYIKNMIEEINKFSEDVKNLMDKLKEYFERLDKDDNKDRENNVVIV